MVGTAEGLAPLTCPTCDTTGPVPECEGSFRKHGIVKVHWESWSNCNLGCKFCYRTLGAPLDTSEARRMLDAVTYAGASSIVFAGGDPTLRKDLPALLEHARQRGLLVEVQTNAHFMPPATKDALLGNDTHLLGISLDGATAERHDKLRSTRGNFRRVIEFLESCRQVDKPVIVRTLINRQNIDVIQDIGSLVAKYENVVRWSLLEFTPVGEGYENVDLFQVTHPEYLEAVERARACYSGPAPIDSYTDEAKVGTYALVTPAGQLYGTVDAVNGRYPLVGSMLRDHLFKLVKFLPFNQTLHQARYGDALAPELEGKGDLSQRDHVKASADNAS